MPKPSPATLSPPDLPPANRLAPFPGPPLQPRTTYEDVAFPAIDLSHSDAQDLVIGPATLTKTLARSARWRNLLLRDARLTACDLANLDAAGATLRRVEILDCRLTGANLSESRFTDVRFTNCAIDSAFFHRCAFERCRFERCNLSAADFEASDLRGILFLDCDLRRSRLTSAKLAGADLRGSKLEGLYANPTDLPGLIIEPLQAPDLAAALGLVLRNRHEP